MEILAKSTFLLCALSLASQSSAQISVAPSPLDFGNISIGLSATKFLSITSSVDGLRATVTANPPFSIPSKRLTLSGQPNLVPVTFAPAAVGAR